MTNTGCDAFWHPKLQGLYDDEMSLSLLVEDSVGVFEETSAGGDRRGTTWPETMELLVPCRL